jgi:pilus assembly protein Flp/PilA
MYEKLTEWAIVAKLMIEGRLEGNRDRGATALEYVGMIVVAAIIVVAITGAVKGANIGGTVTSKIAEIFKG